MSSAPRYRWASNLFRAAFIAAVAAMVCCAAAQRPRTDKAAVVFNRSELFYLYSRVGSFGPEDRAKLVSERIAALADDRSVEPDQIEVRPGNGVTDIMIGDQPIAQVTAADADALGIDRDRLAERYAQRIQKAITSYRTERSVPMVVRGAIYALLATAALLLVLRMLALLFARLAATLRGLRGTRVRGFRYHDSEILTADHVVHALVWLLDAVRIVTLALLLYGYLTLVFGFFPWTVGYAQVLLGYMTEQFRSMGRAVAAAIPDLLTICIIVIIARYTLRAVLFFFTSIERGSISFAGFEREWAIPTYKLVRVLVIALAFVAAFPYIPGSKSPVFQGVSVFLGVIFSIGSGGSMSNMVAGVVMTYMRPFRIGDRVKIADTVGDVVEKGLLVTRIRTIKNVEVTIPNSTVLAGHIVNYSANAREDGLVLHTTVTIGYDAPWRRVHELLIEAAKKTPNIKDRPAPYVLQTSLDDNYVSYELNAYTDQPNRMATIYSMLHQQIQDTFNEAGVEIMSPRYTALRDGNETTIPIANRPEDYRAPAFRVEQTGADGDRT